MHNLNIDNAFVMLLRFGPSASPGATTTATTR